MKYQNTKTGRIIETSSEVIGGLWEPIEETNEQEPAKKEPKKKG